MITARNQTGVERRQTSLDAIAQAQADEGAQETARKRFLHLMLGITLAGAVLLAATSWFLDR